MSPAGTDAASVLIVYSLRVTVMWEEVCCAWSATLAGLTSAAEAACVDTNADSLNCGKCGQACPSDKPFCDGGQCKIYKLAGIVQNLNQDDLASLWKECFSEGYANYGTPLSTLLT